MKWLFVAAQAAALARLLWIRLPYPWFLGALFFWVLQAVNVNFAQPTAEWTETWWRYPEVLLIGLTAAACVEAIQRDLTSVNQYRAHLMRVGAIGLAGCIVGTLAYFVSPLVGDTQNRFNQVRAWIWAFLALSMIIAELLLALDEKVRRSTAVLAHSLLLTAIMLDHTFTAPFVGASNPIWYGMRNIHRPLVIACCVIWATCFVGRGETLRFRLSRR